MVFRSQFHYIKNFKPQKLMHRSFYIILIVLVSSCIPTAQTSSSERDYSDYQDMSGVLKTIAGIQVTGQGASTSVHLRGVGTINLDSQPLFVVDNVPLGRRYSSIDYLNPRDEGSIKIVKGLSATTRWGEDGNHGVIIIRTKMDEMMKANTE